MLKKTGWKFALICCTAICAVLFFAPQSPAGGKGGCPGDANGDGVTNVVDLLTVLSNWGECDDPCTGDLNDDGVVNVQDLLIVINDLGCGQAACATNADCDDEDPCTIDICVQGTCHHIPIPDCK